MKNFPIIDKETGREYWISRSVAVVVLVFAKNNNEETTVLVNVRGKNTPDPQYRGKYCLPCGYVDFDETCREAACREVFEETGLKLNPNRLALIGINDDPKSDMRQNITIKFKHWILGISSESLSQLLTSKNADDGEVENVLFVPVSATKNKELWAFNHAELIEEYLSS